MVYHGPSTGCKTCIKRKIKCDEQYPSCKKCLRRGYTCPGVPGKNREKAAKDDSTAAGPTHLLSPPSSVVEDVEFREPLKVDRVPQQSWRDVAINKWLGYIASDPAQLDPWSIMVINTHFSASPDCAWFDDALSAVSLIRIAREPGLQSLRDEAATAYGRALTRFTSALSTPRLATSDVSIISVRLLIIYGFYVNQPKGGGPPSLPAGSPPANKSDSPTPPPDDASPTSGGPGGPGGPGGSGGPGGPGGPPVGPPGQKSRIMANAKPHLDGQLRLLLLRGPKQLEDPLSSRLFCALRDRICLNYSTICQDLPVKRSNPMCAWFFSNVGVGPIDSLSNYALDVPNIRARMLKLDQQQDPFIRTFKANALKTQSYEVLGSLRRWLQTLPEDWQKPGVTVISPKDRGNEAGFDGLGYVYVDPTVALVMLKYRAYEIMLLQVIAACLRANANMPTEDMQPSEEGQLRLEELSATDVSIVSSVDVICGMLAVYSWTNGRVYELGNQIPPGGLQHVGHLIEPMLLVLTVECISSEKKAFVKAKMREFLT